jgi:hypothetical protein
LMNWDQISPEVRIVDHLQVSCCTAGCHGAVSLKKQKQFV